MRSCLDTIACLGNELEHILKEFRDKCDVILKHRNKRLAHTDRDVGLGKKELPELFLTDLLSATRLAESILIAPYREWQNIGINLENLRHEGADHLVSILAHHEKAEAYLKRHHIWDLDS